MNTLFKLFALILLLLTTLTGYAQNNTKENIAKVENGLFAPIQIEGEKNWNILDRMAFYKTPGLSIAVIQNYRLVWAKGYGFANDSSKTPVTTQTLFQAGSISKSLNAVGVLKVAEEKKIDLYADINVYLKSWKFPYDSLSKGKKITMANLLSHTGGINLQGFGGYLPGKPLPTIVQVLNGEKPANSPRIRSAFEPGLRPEYSGGGIIISQQIVMDITGQDYAGYMQQAVLKPLGMNNSTFSQPPAAVYEGKLATGYNIVGNPIPGRYRIFPEQAAAGLWTNPTDLATFVIGMQLAYEGKSVKVLTQQSARLMFTLYQNKMGIALGAFINVLDSTKYFTHPGSTVGFQSIYYGSLRGGNGVVVMLNSGSQQLATEVVNSVAKVYEFKDLYHPNIKKRVSTPAADVLQTYTGQFQLAPNRVLTILFEEGHFYVRMQGEMKRELLAEAPNKFFLRDLPYELEFAKDTDGSVNLVLYADGQKVQTKRVK
jgi:CubicO group peptidase (beta-lactamase class C family)